MEKIGDDLVKMLMYGSLIVALGCILAFVFIRYSKNKVLFRLHRKIDRILLAGGVAFYIVFVLLSLHAHQTQNRGTQTVSAATQNKIKQAIASYDINKPVSQVANLKIDVKIRTVPHKLRTNQPLSMQFLITNESDFDIKDLRMNFLQGKLAEFFSINEIKGNSKLNILENLVILGTLKKGDTKQVQFDMTPKNNVDYLGKIAWQAGNNFIVGEDGKVLESIISLKLDDEYIPPEDPAFNNFVNLKPIDEIVKEVKEPNTSGNPENPPIETPTEETNGQASEPAEEPVNDDGVVADVYNEDNT